MSLLHLETHNPNRPQPQIPYKHGKRASKLATWLANTDLPPHRMLRITQLRHLGHVLVRRRERLREARAQTEKAIDHLTTPTPRARTTNRTITRTTLTTTHPKIETIPNPFPSTHTPLHHQWLLEKRTRTILAQQAHSLSRALARTPLPRHATPRERQLHTTPHQRTHLCYLRLRAKRQRYAAREGRWLAEHGAWLLERALRRAKWWVKERGEKGSERRVAGRGVKMYEGWRMGLRWDWELDAWRWGVGLRRGVVERVVVRGGEGEGGWPAQESFEMYKMSRYRMTEVLGLGEDEETRAGKEMEIRAEECGFKQAYGSGMLLMGGSPLREAWTLPVVEEV